jgi:hypothetical protein
MVRLLSEDRDLTHHKETYGTAADASAKSAAAAADAVDED